MRVEFRVGWVLVLGEEEAEEEDEVELDDEEDGGGEGRVALRKVSSENARSGTGSKDGRSFGQTFKK